MTIRLDDLSEPEIAFFLEDHLRDMRAASPPESRHALDLDACGPFGNYRHDPNSVFMTRMIDP